MRATYLFTYSLDLPLFRFATDLKRTLKVSTYAGLARRGVYSQFHHPLLRVKPFDKRRLQ